MNHLILKFLKGHPAECLASGLVRVGSTQFQYQDVLRRTFCGVSQTFQFFQNLHLVVRHSSVDSLATAIQ
jgi:hypothetical protein